MGRLLPSMVVNGPFTTLGNVVNGPFTTLRRDFRGPQRAGYIALNYLNSDTGGSATSCGTLIFAWGLHIWSWCSAWPGLDRWAENSGT
jgi:hypothetical protein